MYSIVPTVYDIYITGTRKFMGALTIVLLLALNIYNSCPGVAPLLVRKNLIFTQVQLSAFISPSECATNFALTLLRTAAVAELAYQK